MSCCNNKNCDCHQNGSFIFGLIIGLIIAAVVAIVIYKNNREDVFIKLKKQIEKFISNLKPKSEKIIESFISPDLPKKKTIKKKKNTIKPTIIEQELHKKEVTIPKNLIIAEITPKTVTAKPRKMFKK